MYIARVYYVAICHIVTTVLSNIVDLLKGAFDIKKTYYVYPLT